MLLGDEAIGQFVFIVGLARKMSGEDLAAARYGFTERIAGVAGFDTFGQNVDDLLPGATFDFRIDAAVGEHFDAMFQERDKDQDAGVIASVVKSVLAERREGESMNRFADTISGREKAFDRWHSAGEKTNESADDRPEIQIFRSPRIAPEPFDDYPAE